MVDSQSVFLTSRACSKSADHVRMWRDARDLQLGRAVEAPHERAAEAARNVPPEMVARLLARESRDLIALRRKLRRLRRTRACAIRFARIERQLPARTTRRETRSRTAPARDEGSGGEDPPSPAEAVAMGELVQTTREVRLAQSVLHAQRAGLPCLAAPEGVSHEEAIARVRAALRAQSEAIRACVAASVEPKLPPAPVRASNAARLVPTMADEGDFADVVTAIASRLSPPAGLALLTLAAESLRERGRGVWLSELGLARATRELDEDLGADGTAHAIAELSRAGLVWAREEGVRLAVRRAPHPLLKMPLRMCAAVAQASATSSSSSAPTNTNTRGLRIEKGGAHG